MSWILWDIWLKTALHLSWGVYQLPLVWIYNQYEPQQLLKYEIDVQLFRQHPHTVVVTCQALVMIPASRTIFWPRHSSCSVAHRMSCVPVRKRIRCYARGFLRHWCVSFGVLTPWDSRIGVIIDRVLFPQDCFQKFECMRWLRHLGVSNANTTMMLAFLSKWSR